MISQAEFGIVGTLFAWIGFTMVVFGLGFEAAYFKFASTGELGTRAETLTTPWLATLGSSLIFSALLFIGAAPIAHGLGFEQPLVPTLVRYATLIVFFDILAILPYSELRSSRRAGMFAALRSVNIIVNVALNIVFLVVYHRGIEGIFLANVISSAFTFVVIAVLTFRTVRFTFSKTILREFFRFGLPYIPAALAAMMLQVIDRPILKWLTNDATVGLYTANYRLGIIMMLVVSMFEYAWRPFFLAHARDENAKELFARVLTYFSFGACALFLVVSLWINDIVAIPLSGGRYLIAPEYWSGLGIVPIILLGYIFNGFYTNFVAGIYIEKKTSLLPKATIAGAAANVILNILLIPTFGIYGAAYATLFAYMIMAFYLYRIVHPIYPVRYEWSRLIKLGSALAVTYVSSIIVSKEGLVIGLAGWIIRIAILLSFFGLLTLTRFFHETEKIRAKNLLTDLKKRLF